MELKIGLIFLVTLTTGLCFGNDLKYKNTKKGLPSIDIKQVPKNITELVDFVALNEILKLWRQSNFLKCFDEESHEFSYSAVRYAYNCSILLNDSDTPKNEENKSFAIETCEYIVRNFDLIEKARRIIYQVAKNSTYDDEKLKYFLDPIKVELKSNFLNIDENLLKMPIEVDLSVEDENITKIANDYKRNVENMKNKSMEYVEKVKKCLTKSNL